MKPEITHRPRARLDLLEQFVYFGEHAGVDWLNATLRLWTQRVSNWPNVRWSARKYDTGIVRLKGLRRFPVKGFENYRLFYLPNQNCIDVIRVLHGARDIDNIFADEEGSV